MSKISSSDQRRSAEMRYVPSRAFVGLCTSSVGFWKNLDNLLPMVCLFSYECPLSRIRNRYKKRRSVFSLDDASVIGGNSRFGFRVGF